MSDRIEITILGCGSSGGVPRVGNDWGNCDPANPKNRRLRCSLLIERISGQHKTSVLIDTGPDLRQQLLDTGVDHLDAVVYTHPHADHLHGIDDLRMLAIRHRKRVPVYMDEPTHDRAMHAFGYCFETPPGSSYPPILERIPFADEQILEISGAGGALQLLPVRVQHGDITSLAFRFNDTLYLPDVSDIPERSANQFRGLDTLILDSLRRPPHPSHFNLEDALAWSAELKPRRTVLTNMHNDLDYEVLRGELPEHIEPAYDGMTWTIDL